jgi:hypothetical protein
VLLTKKEIEMIFQQAKSDGSSKQISSPPSESYMYKGIKILSDSTSTRIQTSGMSYYQELSTEQYDLFKNGWIEGSCRLLLIKYQTQKKNLELKIRDEINGNNSMKALKGYRIRRDTINSKHQEVSNKLNYLTNKK